MLNILKTFEVSENVTPKPNRLSVTDNRSDVKSGFISLSSNAENWSSYFSVLNKDSFRYFYDDTLSSLRNEVNMY